GKRGMQRRRPLPHAPTGPVSLPAGVTSSPETRAPTWQIVKPFLNQNLATDTPIQFQAITFDPNEPFRQVPCARIVWTSNVAGDPTLTGCTPEFTFHTAGPRTFTVTATDSQGVSVTSTQTATVSPKFPPPQLTIASPVTGQAYAF